ncbi:hypothetical protein [Bifidobacterium eulemuris]|uniref:Peptidase n=1 Tax=Bifidobacterium eulemuris TaxID=1765219 RepID=A0A261GBK8_9BIFI|nr:hypothetical protein [Bifidobacterium eulemuris]OZG68555.1 peptidase [Bifidobacterium eulemuris]QOL32684.1 hypothetical protein BE0216_09730 [Bifidobacterium eulemuris]
MNIRQHFPHALIAAIAAVPCCIFTVPALANDSPTDTFAVSVNESSISVTATIPDEFMESGFPYLWATVNDEIWGPYGDGVNSAVSFSMPITPECGITYHIAVHAGDDLSMVAELGTTTAALPDSTCTPGGDAEQPAPPPPTEPAEPTKPTEPAEPVDPIEPSEPSNPVEPSNPTVPTDPIEPAEPTAPAVPTEPTTPTNPTPSNPATPTNPQDSPTSADPTSTQNTTTPKDLSTPMPTTGVNITGIVYLLITILAISLVVCGLLLSLRKTRNA